MTWTLKAIPFCLMHCCWSFLLCSLLDSSSLILVVPDTLRAITILLAAFATPSYNRLVRSRRPVVINPKLHLVDSCRLAEHAGRYLNSLPYPFVFCSCGRSCLEVETLMSSGIVFLRVALPKL